MKKKNETILCRWVEDVWNKGCEKTIDELFDDDAVADYPYNSDKTPIYGKEDYKNFVRFIRSLFTDIRVTIEQIASDDQKVIALCTFVANHRKIADENPSVNNQIKVSGLSQIIIENDKITRAWCNIDLFGAIESKKKQVAKVAF